MYVEYVDLLLLIVQLMDANGRSAIMSPTTVTITNITRRWRGGNPTETVERPSQRVVRVRFHIIRNARIDNVGKSQSCMVSKVRIIWKQTVTGDQGWRISTK